MSMPTDDAIKHAVREISIQPAGRTRLCWMLDCVELRLCTPEFAHDFLSDFCAVSLAVASSGRPAHFADIWTETSGGSPRAKKRPGGYLRQGPPLAVDPNEFAWFSTVMSYSKWLQYHGYISDPDEAIQRATSARRRPPPNALEFEAILDSGPDKWWAKGRWLGSLPSVRGSGWVSGHPQQYPTEIGPENSGQSLWLSRGMWPGDPRHTSSDWASPMVLYTVDVQALLATQQFHDTTSFGRRPLFCDGGTQWFKVRPMGPAGKTLATQGWGQSCDLRKGAVSLLTDTGVSERVLFPISLDHPAVSRPRFLQACPPPTVPSPDSGALDRLLQVGRTEADIAHQVQALFS